MNVAEPLVRRTLAFVTRLALLTDLHFWQRLIQLNLGLMIFGLAISLMLRADLGLDPWSVLHEGLSARTGLSFGRVTQLVGLALLIFNFFALRVRPGLGTVLNMALVGPWVDFFEAQRWLPRAEDLGSGIALVTVGVILTGLASGLYLGARMNAGPRDTLVLGSARRFGRSVRLTRGSIEVLVLTVGFLLGGTVGLGTVIFALLIGPTMQFFLGVFRYEHLPVAGVTSAASG